jgi:hypothetical protein
VARQTLFYMVPSFRSFPVGLKAVWAVEVSQKSGETTVYHKCTFLTSMPSQAVDEYCAKVGSEIIKADKLPIECYSVM